ncbi:MAG TPA: branched-chain amino acid aminotransferase [Planctomycetota bacterium]|jgi:branched-chain amino acid aminotransferase
MARKKFASPGFGKLFLPQMVLQQYAGGKWGTPKIVRYADFKLPPSSVVFHYGQEIFEGFKVYRQPDGSACMFRPLRNLARMNASAERLSMAQINEKQVLESICALVRRNKDYIPDAPQTLYVRPCMFGTDTVIKVHPSPTYTFFVIVSVVGGYFAGDDPRGVRLRTETKYTRAAPGGTGAAKCGGNYAASLAAQQEASKDGFDQVVWLDGREHRFIEEMGGMNIMFVLGDALITPSLASGSILPGVTRDSLLQLARDQKIKIEERDISVDELIAAQKSGKLKEAFACGTAAVVTPIREIMHESKVLYRNLGKEAGALTMRLRQQLVDIQFGNAPDPHGWRFKIKL